MVREFLFSRNLEQKKRGVMPPVPVVYDPIIKIHITYA